MSQPVYPLPPPNDGPHITFALVRDIAAVLAAHGFPPLDTWEDHLALQRALRAFVHGDRT